MDLIYLMLSNFDLSRLVLRPKVASFLSLSLPINILNLVVESLPGVKFFLISASISRAVSFSSPLSALAFNLLKEVLRISKIRLRYYLHEECFMNFNLSFSSSSINSSFYSNSGAFLISLIRIKAMLIRSNKTI